MGRVCRAGEGRRHAGVPSAGLSPQPCTCAPARRLQTPLFGVLWNLLSWAWLIDLLTLVINSISSPFPLPEVGGANLKVLSSWSQFGVFSDQPPS